VKDRQEENIDVTQSTSSLSSPSRNGSSRTSSISKRQYLYAELFFALVIPQKASRDPSLLYTSRYFQSYGDAFDDTFKFVGPSIAPRITDHAFPFEALHDGPLLSISLGTLFDRQNEFYRCCFEAFEQSDYQVVMSNRTIPTINRSINSGYSHSPLPHDQYTFIFRCAILLLRYLSSSKPRKKLELLPAKVVNNGHFFHLLRVVCMETIAKRAKHHRAWQAKQVPGSSPQCNSACCP